MVLDRERDALGMPRVALHWRPTEQDLHSIDRWLVGFAAAVEDRGLGQVVRPSGDWLQRIVGGPHHMGTTRMADDHRHGVVDRNCRVHSTSNLYIAGSSVFSTGGYANPTFTIVELALRLADHLRDEAFRGAVATAARG